MRKISLQSSLQTTHTTTWKCRSLCSPGRGAAASYFGRRSGISVAWREILDTDTRVREVTGSLLSEHCSSAGQLMRSEELVHPALLVPSTEGQLCLQQRPRLREQPQALQCLSRAALEPRLVLSIQSEGCTFPKRRDCAWAAGSSSSSGELLCLHTSPSETKRCLKQTCPALKCSSLFQLSTALEIWKCKGISKA